jgi:catechol 2,3-dioxygenase-like lactoylglutathione lyase family enzyme
MSDWVLKRQYHTVVNCRDIDESLAFYKLLGFEVLHDRRDQVWPEFLAGIFGLDRAQGRAVLVVLPSDPEGPLLDLVEWVEPKAVFTDPAEVRVTVPRTIAFETRGVIAAYEELSAKGVRFTVAPTPLPEAMGIIAIAFCYDPSGNVVELVEPAPGFRQTMLDNALDAGLKPS